MNYKYQERWDSILKDFENHHRSFAGKVVEMCPVGNKEMVFYTNDGKRIYYDFYEKTYQFLPDKIKKNSEKDENEWRETFMNRLNRMMRIRGFTLERLSDATGISMVTLYKYTNGKSTPSGYNLMRLTNALNCTEYEITHDSYDTLEQIEQ